MKVIADCIVDEALLSLRLPSCLISENHIVIPPSFDLPAEDSERISSVQQALAKE